VRRDQKERVVEQLTERLRSAETLLVADYRGLTMSQIDALRTRLRDSGARFTVVKNTLTRRAAEAAGADAVLALLEGPSAIAFLDADGDMVAVAKALADAARETRVLEIRGGVTQGRVVTAAEVAHLATLPPLEILRGQVLGAIVAPVTAIAGLVNAPLQNLRGLIEARIEQLEAQDGTTAAAPPEAEEGTIAADAEPASAEEAGASDEEPTPADATASASDDVDTSTESEEA
jgi:large subunit ribosomal protein L10